MVLRGVLENKRLEKDSNSWFKISVCEYYVEPTKQQKLKVKILCKSRLMFVKCTV